MKQDDHAATPGPWHTVGLEIISRHETKNGNRHRCHVATVTNRNDINRQPSMEEYATARLIASAPEVISALEEMLAAFSMKSVGVDHSTRRIAAKKQARDAIAKAKGD